ncbi:MAG TPA: ATP-binding cassette domain-containing protein [Candidatus Paceibacterota bacterium]|nr:ATP-binding cassette domain-containing protein [Candidatus Paceibacterota bacterium]
MARGESGGSRGATIVRFEEVSFGYGVKKPILQSADFTVRRGSKITIMGQNGAGKSTIFALLTGALKPDDGEIEIAHGLSVALSRQVIPREQLGFTVREFFKQVLPGPAYDIDHKIDKVLGVVNLAVAGVHERALDTFSGGQQARILLVQALIQDPDLLLLDEPTNNLDAAGIAHLTQFLKEYGKTVLVISHDAEFLNAFSDGVLYLDVRTKKVQQFVGNYDDVQKEVAAAMARDNRANALREKEIQANKDKANFFANKGGQMRLVAKRMREKADELESEMVDVRHEDKAIRPFRIPFQEGVGGEMVRIESLSIMNEGEPREIPVEVSLRRGEHLLLKGPNGIGKSTLLAGIAERKAKGVTVAPGIVIGYYRQDFSNLDFEKSVRDELAAVLERPDEQELRRIAAAFQLTGDIFHTRIGVLSEGQKALTAFARLVLLKPGLLILDEPTNHVNFRHLPVIAEALSEYEGPMILVSHVPDFVEKIRIDQQLDLEQQAAKKQKKGKK